MSLTPRLDRLEKNYIINGAMDYWQRNNGVSTAADGMYPDRWSKAQSTLGGSYTISRVTDAPLASQSGFQGQYCTRLTTATVGTPVAASYLYAGRYVMEGHDFANIAGKEIRISFWVKSSVTGTYTLQLTDGSGNSRSYVIPYTVNVANTWEEKIFDVDLASMGGSPEYGAGQGMRIYLYTHVGSNFHTGSPNQWINGDIPGVAGMAPFATTLGATFQFTQVAVSLAFGPTPITRPFTRAGATIAEELILCQRYFEKSYRLADPVGTASLNGAHFATAGGTGTIQQTWHVKFAVSKRTPNHTLLVYNPSSGAVNSARNYSVAGDISANRTNDPSEFGDSVIINGSTTAGNRYAFHWTCDAEF